MVPPTSSSSASSQSAAQAGAGADWPAEITNRIESAVGAVRDRTTVPATFVAKAIVYGVVLGALTAAIVLLVVIALVRLLDVYLPFHPVGRRVWVVDAGASAIFLLVGAFFWGKRRPKEA